jgi:hypothetical protein
MWEGPTLEGVDEREEGSGGEVQIVWKAHLATHSRE